MARKFPRAVEHESHQVHINDIFILDPGASNPDFDSAIRERIAQAQAVVVALSTEQNVDELTPHTFGNALWIVRRLLDELDVLYSHQWDLWHASQQGGQANG